MTDNPFDGEAKRIMRSKGLSLSEARDCVVNRYLRNGRTEALAFWLERDYQPGLDVRNLLSLMLQPIRVDSNDPDKEFPVPLEQVRYELVAKDRSSKRGPRQDPVAHERNSAIRDYYHRRTAELGPGSSESVILELSEMPGLSESMVREAIKVRSPKSG
jgi:hypothetical protein